MRNAAIYIITPLAGFIIMGIEVLGFRAMQPEFGSVFFINPVIIGVVLIAMSLGYYLGGWSVDKYPKLHLLGIYLLIAGIATIMIPIIKDGFTEWVFESEVLSVPLGKVFNPEGLPDSWYWSDVFFAAFVLFFIPSMMLACVLPFSIKLLTKDIEHAGRTAGALIALSSLGSILGVFLTTLVFINKWGVKANFYILGIALIVLALLGIAVSIPWMNLKKGLFQRDACSSAK